jgi:hypothetical protein
MKAGTRAESRFKVKPAEAGERREMPAVVFACVCEQALQEKDGVVSLIRIVDTFHLELRPVIDQMSQGAVTSTVFRSLTAPALRPAAHAPAGAGNTRGHH